MFKLSKIVNTRRLPLLFFLTIVAMEYAAAQPTGPDPLPNRSAAELMQSYSRGGTDSVKGQELLIGVLNKTLPSTDANIRITRQSLARSVAIDEKILLIKVLASMYTPRVRSQQNLLIESDIKKLIDSTDQRLGAEAVFEYSRLAYPSDRYEVLQRARGAKIIDDDAYYGEIAHGLRFSSRAQQSQMLAELETARNWYGNEILAATFGNEELVVQLDRSAQVGLLKILSDSEPGFPLALDSFGVIDIARYVDWVNAAATIESRLGGKAYAELVLRRLSDPRVDPRKILAIFGNPEGQRVIRESKDMHQLRMLLSRAQAYANSLPQNVMINGAAGSFTRQMSGRAGSGR
jgi:hypothetical protein